MPDRRSHRGPHPEDQRLFARTAWPDLRVAAGDLVWLLARGYSGVSALKLVGDRYQLVARQRTAVMRATCSPAQAARRRQHEVSLDALSRKTILVDGYNVLTTIEAALGGGVILASTDGAFRDMASMHGSYRKVAETLPAIDCIGRTCAEHELNCHWYLDSPVSNSGRLRAVLLDTARERGWNWQVELVADPDRILAACADVVATADAGILERCQRWVNLARAVVSEHVPQARTVDFAGSLAE